MLLEKISFLTEIEATLTAQLKRIKAERKQLEIKQAKLAEFLELQAELMSDPDTADSLPGGGSQPQIAPVTIEIVEVEATAIAPDITDYQSVMTAAAGIWEQTPATEPAEITPTIPDETNSNPDEIKVIWETQSSGYTLDGDGIKRHFEFERWDDLGQPIVTLTTSKGKVISSNWKSVKISGNKHFQAIKEAQLNHILNEVWVKGYTLKETLSLNNTASFFVIRDGIQLGRISFAFGLWFLGKSFVMAGQKYGSIWKCLAALEQETATSAQALADIGF